MAALLARVDQGKEELSRVVHFGKSDLVPYAPIASRHVESGMTLDALGEAAITVSDNAAANLLLNAVGGFGEFNGFVRSLGDETTRLDRNEPTLNDPDGDKGYDDADGDGREFENDLAGQPTDGGLADEANELAYRQYNGRRGAAGRIAPRLAGGRQDRTTGCREAMILRW